MGDLLSVEMSNTECVALPVDDASFRNDVDDDGSFSGVVDDDGLDGVADCPGYFSHPLNLTGKI